MYFFILEEEENMTKQKVAWITDTTASLSEEFINKYQINVIPLQLIINQESYRETIDITEKEFYERMKNENGTFQTSQPSIGDFVDVYKKLKEEYDFGFAIHASSILSGTFQTSKMAAEMADFKLFAFDSRTGSYPHSFIVKKAVELFEQGYSAEEILKELAKIPDRTRLFLVPSNLDQLHKSGRVTGGQKILASLLNIKPILSIEDGTARIKDKVRSDKKALSWLMDKLKSDMEKYTVKKVVVVHANDPERATKLEKLVKELVPNMDTACMMLITVAGVHTGVGTLGLSWVCE
jgi:DegV family protein with EDD domain